VNDGAILQKQDTQTIWCSKYLYSFLCNLLCGTL